MNELDSKKLTMEWLVTGVAAYDEKTCGLKQNGDGLAASIFTWSGTYIDTEGNDAVLLCRATGNPAPKVTWLNSEDEPITTGANYQVITPSNILFHTYIQYFIQLNLLIW